MALNKASKMKEIVATPGGVEVIEKYWPGMTSNEAFKAQAMDLPVKLVTTFPETHLDKETCKKLFADLEAL